MPGDTIAAMGAVVTVDTSNELWVESQVPASLVALIKPGSALSGRNFTTNAETSACCAGHHGPPRKIEIDYYISIQQYISCKMPELFIALHSLRR